MSIGTITGEHDVRIAVERVRERIRLAGGDPDEVTLVAVTKGFGPEMVEAVLATGVVEVAESYAQELEAKAAAVLGPRWHFVGRLQSNKVRRVASIVELWQSIDRHELVTELARRSPGGRVFVQVNVTGEQGKGGCDPASARGLVDELTASALRVEGLMAVGAAGDPEASRSGFRRLATLADELELTERSMGMSADLEVAVEEGSTMIRVGRALFGPRPAKTGSFPTPPCPPVTG